MSQVEHKLLLVSSSEELREAVEAALLGWREPHRLYWVTQPELAASRVIELIPRVILVDDELGASPERYTRQLSDVSPLSVVVALVASERVDLANRMVLNGARAVLQKPIRADEMQQTLSTLLASRASQTIQPHEDMLHGRVVTVVGARGGVGRTSVAVNLAVSLHQATGEPVALVDADFESPAVDVMLNVLGRRTMAELFERSSSIDADLLRGVVNRHTSGIDVLLAPGPGDPPSNLGTARVERLLMMLKRLFMWTIIDLGQPWSEAGAAFADGADALLFVLSPELVSIRNSRPLLEHMRSRGYGEDKIWGVLNRGTARHGIPIVDIESRLLSIRHSIPDDPSVSLASINRGVPVSMRHRHSALARSYRQLASKLVNAYAAEDESASRTARPAKAPRRQRAPKRSR